jgi:hypothetical protein
MLASQRFQRHFVPRLEVVLSSGVFFFQLTKSPFSETSILGSILDVEE